MIGSFQNLEECGEVFCASALLETVKRGLVLTLGSRGLRSCDLGRFGHFLECFGRALLQLKPDAGQVDELQHSRISEVRYLIRCESAFADCFKQFLVNLVVEAGNEIRRGFEQLSTAALFVRLQLLPLRMAQLLKFSLASLHDVLKLRVLRLQLDCLLRVRLHQSIPVNGFNLCDLPLNDG